MEHRAEGGDVALGERLEPALDDGDVVLCSGGGGHRVAPLPVACGAP
jgi:hypothetical protein